MTHGLPNIKMPDERFSLRRANLVEAIQRARFGAAGSASRRPTRRAVLAIAASILFVAAGSALALTQIDFLGEQAQVDREAWTPPEWKPQEPRVELERGLDWSFMAWHSAGGICVAYAAGDASNWARACGPVSADSTASLLTWLYVPSQTSGASDGHGAMAGAVTPDVDRIEVELADGRVLSAQTRPAAGVAAEARFFLVRESAMLAAERPVASIALYGADGELLDSGPPGSLS